MERWTYMPSLALYCVRLFRTMGAVSSLQWFEELRQVNAGHFPY